MTARHSWQKLKGDDMTDWKVGDEAITTTAGERRDALAASRERLLPWPDNRWSAVDLSLVRSNEAFG
jgi:hypothetical protein